MSGMSVGISQVNFDAQVLEDEDEEALEKEDQEREQEIRELLDSELDDGLLDDDNASFSSHDFRSSGYSRDTPFSEDFSEQPPPESVLDHAYGNARNDMIPSERGVFDRPPLITQHGAQLISGSKQGTDTERPFEVQYPYDYAPANYHQDYDDTGYYDYQRGSLGDQEENNYQRVHESSLNYETFPDGLNNGLEAYTDYSPHSEAAFEAPGMQGNGYHAYNDRRRTEDKSDGRSHNVHGDNSQDSSNNNHYRLDNLGNYRVQYHGQQGETFSHFGERRFLEDNRADAGVHEIASAGCEDGGEKTQDITQLQILYKARGRKLEELSRKLEVQEEEMAKQVRVLNHQNALLRDERDGFSTSLEQSQKAIQECNTEINNLKGQLAASAQQLHAIKSSKDEALNKLHIAETTVDSLNQQVAELSRSESLARAKEQHENVVNAITRKHNEENLELKQKLDEAVFERDWKTEEANRLREELVEKAEMVNSLTRSLDSSQKQCQELLQTGTMSEINQLRLALQDSSSSRNVVEGECITLKHQLSELQEQVKMYESAARLGVTIGSATVSDTFPHITVRNLNKENWSTPKSHKLPLEETITDLRKELEQCLVINKTKRAEVNELEGKMTILKENLRENESKALRMEKIAQEQQERATELEKKVQYLENDKKDPDKELKKTLEEVALAKKKLEDTARHLGDTFKEKEELSEACADLKQQMAQMVQEFDEDKRTSLEKCREACLQLHEEGKKLLREELNEKHQQFVKVLRNELEEKNEELIRIQECYVQLSEDSRGLREQFDKEKQALLSERESQLTDKLRSSLEKEYTAQLEAAQETWKVDERKRIEEKILRENKQKTEEEKLQATEEAVTSAVKDSQSDLADQIAVARREWLKDHEDELEKRLSNAVGEMRRIWDEEQKLKTEEEIEEVREALKKSHQESRHREINQAVELALSQAHSDWLKNDEEMRQREIDQAVEVAVTNAVAEAKEQWEKEAKAQDNVLQTCITQERLRWKKEEELERSRALEAAVAIAEVKWLDEEQKKITEAVEQALLTTRETWQGEKQRDLAMAVDEARREWSVQKEKELNCAMETARSQLVEQFEEQKGVAVEKALSQARLQWEQKAAEVKTLATESLRQETFREFQDRKEAGIQETVKEPKECWKEEVEAQKQAEINKAIAYLESQYAKGLEEFKRKELRLALEEARKQWTAEQRSNLEDAVHTRLTSAREEWHKEVAQSTQVEVDRALSTAREAWVANYEDELEERVNQLEGSLRERLASEYAKEKKQLIEDTLREAQSKFEAEKKKLEDEIRRHKPDDSSRDKEQEERRRLVKEHQNQLQRVRNECESKVKDASAKAKADISLQMENALKEARKEWEEEQHDVRLELERENEQRTRRAVGSAKQEWYEEEKKEVAKACELAVRRQRELWSSERRQNQSALENVKRELATVKKEYALSLNTLKREVLEEKKKTQHSLKRQDSRDCAIQTTTMVDSGTDASFSSLDHVTASRGLHELRQHYLDTIAKIRHDVLDHVNQTKISASKKIRGEVLKERHSTAKKLRRYYLQCLKQLLEEDRIALEGSSIPSSTEDKLKRMAIALKTPSPSKESTEQSPPPAIASQSDHSPRSDVFTGLRPGSETNIREPRMLLSTSESSERHGDCGPDGASDSPRLSARKESGLTTPVLGDLISKDDFETMSCRSPGAKHFAAERESTALHCRTADAVSKDAFQTVKTFSNPLVPHPAEEHVSQATSELHYRHKTTLAASAEKDILKAFVRPAQTATAHTQKRLASVKRSAPSPALSVTSVESDQYSELPTVIRIPPKQDSTSTSLVRPAARDLRQRPRVQNRIGKLVSRDRATTNGSPGLPSKPRVDINNNCGASRR